MYLGISIDENNAYVNIYGNEEVYSLPFAIGKNLTTGTWFIGEEAKEEMVEDRNIVIDKLYYIMENNRSAKIGDGDYKVDDLVKYFFENLFKNYENIDYVTVLIKTNKLRVVNILKKILYDFIGDYSKIKVTTFSEGLVAMVEDKIEDDDSSIAVFDFTDKSIIYYELNVYKNNDEVVCLNVTTKNFFAIPIDVLQETQGQIVCDTLMHKFAKETLKNKLYRKIILSGVGFTNSANYREFMTLVCMKTSVETIIDFFARAASNISYKVVSGRENGHYYDKEKKIYTDARTTTRISLYATKNNDKTKIRLIEDGEEWFSIDESFDIIVDDTKEIAFEILRVMDNEIFDRKIYIPKDITIRNNKTNIIELNLSFEEQELLNVSIKDKGFGDFFESTKLNIITEGINLRKD